VKDYFKDISATISGVVVEHPVLRTPVNIALVVCVVVVVLLGIVIGIYILVRYKSNTSGMKLKSLHKTLGRRKKGEQESLLNSV